MSRFSDFFIQTKNKPHRSIYHAEFSKYANVCQGASVAPWHTFLCKNWQVWGPTDFHEFATDSYETIYGGRFLLI